MLLEKFPREVTLQKELPNVINNLFAEVVTASDEHKKSSCVSCLIF
jgi:hypothetical protein